MLFGKFIEINQACSIFDTGNTYEGHLKLELDKVNRTKLCTKAISSFTETNRLSLIHLI